MSMAHDQVSLIPSRRDTLMRETIMMNPTQRFPDADTAQVEQYLSAARQMQAEALARGARRAYSVLMSAFTVPGGIPELRRPSPRVPAA